MMWSIEISQKGQDDIERLDEAIRIKIENKIVWLAEHAEEIIHQHLKSMPEDLIGYRSIAYKNLS